MKKGFTLIETLLALILGSFLSVGYIKYQINETKNLQIKELGKEINELIDGVDKRIAIDGYSASLWNKKSWADHQLNDLIKKQLQGVNSSCNTGEWTPSNGNTNLKLVSCSLFNKRYFNIQIEAKIKENLGFIEEFIVDYKFKNEKDFKNNFMNVRNAFVYAKGIKQKGETGTTFYQFIDKATNNEINLKQCINKKTDCIFRTTLDRQGGEEYLKVDGSNSMINSNISFIDTRGNAPLKCVHWKLNSGNWTKSIDESCGIGIYNKTNTPKIVEVTAKNGMFENVMLDKECNLLDWNGTTVVETGNKSPCGLLKNGSEIIQVVETVKSDKGYFNNVYAKNLNVEFITTKNLIANDIVAQKIESNNLITNNADIKRLNVRENTTFSGQVTMNNNAQVVGNLTVNNDTGTNRLFSNYISSSGDIHANGTINGNGTVQGNHLYSRGGINAEGTVSGNHIYSRGDMNAERQINANTLYSRGRTYVQEYLELRGHANENWGCSPNGLLGRDGSGKLLTCINGRWTASAGSVRERTVTAQNSGHRFSNSYAYCNSDEFVSGGGGGCRTRTGYVFLARNEKNGNGWMVACDGGGQKETAYSNVYAICIKR